MRTRSPRGFTLIELLMTLAISSIVIIGITGTFIAQVRQYKNHASRAGLQSSARQAMRYIDDRLRNAGYGIEPDRAFLAYDGFDAVGGGTASNLAYPDAIVLHERDPVFQRTITSVTATQIDVQNVVGGELPAIFPGQIFAVMCQGANQVAYVTAKDYVAPNTAFSFTLDGTPGTTDVPTGKPAGSRWFQAASSITGGCTSRILVRINRYAFYLDAFDDDGVAATPNTPYLMMHRGLDLNVDGSFNRSDGVPIAAGIEQLQIAYFLNSGANSAPLVVGVTTTATWGEKWWNPSTNGNVTGPALDAAYNDPSRRTNHPANIRQIRVSLVARSAVTDPSVTGDDLFEPTASYASGALTSGTTVWRQMENLADTAPATFRPEGRNYHRTVLRVSVAPKNLLMRSRFMPPNGTNGG